MLTKKELLIKIQKFNPHADLELIGKAYDFAKQYHKGQKRDSGLPFFVHPVTVAEYLADLQCGSSTICGGLLHDVVEDTSATLDDVKEIFGKDIAGLVESVTKVDKVHFVDMNEYKAENLRKILLATAKDVRVMLIKLCDRLHNMETLNECDEKKQIHLSNETLSIFAPIAHKLGMWGVKGRLEDTALRYIDPKAYYELKKKIASRRIERESKTKEVISILEEELKEAHLPCKVTGRAKYFYSIYKKMKKDKKEINEIYDLIAVRIVTTTVAECYAVLRIVHTLWKPLMSRFKDYIKTPKPNGYESIHTTVKLDETINLEIQIRTSHMNDHAEDGIAAHWRYKGSERDKKFDMKIAWLKQLLEWKHDMPSDQDVDEILFDLFQDEIVVFTPQGDPIILPELSTPVDFAYEVHTSVGNTCVQAKVNRKAVPLDTKLESGDVVEINNKRGAMPNRAWLSFVKTHLARNKIRQALNIQSEIKPRNEEKEGNISILVKGKKVKLGGCCNIEPGAPVVGVINKDKKIVAHSPDCINAKERKIIQASWEKTLETVHQIKLVFGESIGVVHATLPIILLFSGKIYSVNTKSHKQNLILTVICKEIQDVKGLRSTLNGLDHLLDLHIKTIELKR